MGYNLKTPWDSAELEKEAISVIAPIVGSSSFIAHNTSRDYVVDLKLGGFGDPGDKFNVPQSSAMNPSSCGSSRKARTRSNGAQVASCLVDGCGSDLSTCRDYHRRHKVCEVHSKTPIVTIGGQERRFCQQCSRFHSLVEFDEGKRSCRKRLDGHNRRRRKPQPEAVTMAPGRFLSNHQGTRYFPFSNPQVPATNTVATSLWAGVVKAENDPVLYGTSHSLISFGGDRKSSFPGASFHTYGGKQFSFLHGTTSTLPGDSVPVSQPPLIDPNGGSSNQKMFVNDPNRVINSDRALSLLSSPPAKTQEFGFVNVAQSSSNPPSHSLISSSFAYSNLRPQVEPAAAASNVLVSNHSQGMFQTGLDRSSANMPHQTLSFSWE